MKSLELDHHTSDVTSIGRPDTPPPAFQALAARIVVISGPDAGLSARIDRPTFVVGTGATADLRLSDKAVSREHLHLTLVPDGVHLRDPGSTNGAWMSTLRVNDVVIVRSTEILVGSTLLSLAVEGSAFDLTSDEAERLAAETGERLSPAPCCRRCISDTPGDQIERASEALAHLPYQDAREIVFHHFQRAYLPAVLARAGNVVIRAAKLAGVRRGSFHRMLRRIRPTCEPSARTTAALLSTTLDS